MRLKKASKKPINWQEANDIRKRVTFLIKSVGISNFDTSRIFCYRSTNANTRAYARIWGFAKIWQMALNQKPAYILEVISEKFDRLSGREKDRVLLHEIVHIPKNFSGALVPHRRHGKGKFSDKLKYLINIFEDNS